MVLHHGSEVCKGNDGPCNLRGEISMPSAYHKPAYPHRRISDEPLDRSNVDKVLLNRIAKRLNSATLPMLRPDRPVLRSADKSGPGFRLQNQDSVRNTHEQIDLHRVRAIQQNDVAQHRPSERAHLAGDQCLSERTDRSGTVRLLSEHARRANVAGSRPPPQRARDQNADRHCRGDWKPLRRGERCYPSKAQRFQKRSTYAELRQTTKRQAPGDHAASCEKPCHQERQRPAATKRPARDICERERKQARHDDRRGARQRVR